MSKNSSFSERYHEGYLKPPPPSVVDNFAGIVPLTIEAENEACDPEVFVVATDSTDESKYSADMVVDRNGSGAGLTYQDALMAAVGESIERYALSIIHPEDLLLGSYTELNDQANTITPPEQWALYDAKQFKSLPYPHFNRDTRIAWVHAENLTKKKDTLVPACMVYIPYYRQLISQAEEIVTIAISTGASCATSRSEAILKGICEVIERDAFMIMWRNQLSLPRVSIDSESDIYSIYKEKFCRPGLEYRIVYTTLDLCIPSFFGIVVDSRYDPPSIVVGGASHPDPSRAVLKTLLELAQGIKWRDYMKNKSIRPIERFDNIRSFKDRALLYASNDMLHVFDFIWNGSKNLSLSSIASLDLFDNRMNISKCVNILKERKLDVLALDLTPIDAFECGLYVTKILIPGSEVMEGDHTTPFLGGYRWKEVPFDMGLVSAIPDTGTINLYPHPYP